MGVLIVQGRPGRIAKKERRGKIGDKGFFIAFLNDLGLARTQDSSHFKGAYVTCRTAGDTTRDIPTLI
jgi:hypothetical protein